MTLITAFADCPFWSLSEKRATEQLKTVEHCRIVVGDRSHKADIRAVLATGLVIKEVLAEEPALGLQPVSVVTLLVATELTSERQKELLLLQ